jgi:hypothetical protein
MPQANNQFTGSKMNKDLSPRLVPNTQYIDARNATVLNSEGGESGLLQNVGGNTLLTNLNLTGENLEIVGLFSDKVLNRMFLFVTNWNDPSSNESSNFASPQSSHYICMYDVNTSTASTLVSGSFLNFSKTKPILAVNLLEDLLFFTDNRNQPRKININHAISDSTYYTEEANISVLRYFPWNAPRLSKNTLSPGETDKYPLEVRSELLITTKPIVINKASDIYSVPISTSGWTTSGSGVDAYISITIEGDSPSQYISNVLVSDVDGGNDFSIGDTITIGYPWTNINSSAGDIVLTIESQNIAQTPTMNDVVSTNLPGAIERRVTNNISPTTFAYGSPVKRGDNVWNGTVDGVVVTDRPIRLTQYSLTDPISASNFVLQGSGGNEGLGLEVTVDFSDGTNYDLTSDISTNVTDKINIGTTIGVVPSAVTGTGTGLIVDITTGGFTGAATVIGVNFTSPGTGYSIGDTITFAGSSFGGGASGGGGQDLILTLQTVPTSKSNYIIAVPTSGNDYSIGNQLLIKSQSNYGPIPGLDVDLTLNLDSVKLSLLADNSFIGTIITSVSVASQVDLSDDVKITANTIGVSSDSVITHTQSFNFTNGDYLTFGANPLYDSTFDGNSQFLTEKFVRFSYRFKFDDNQYSLIAPFTQLAFIPKQDGYFTEDAIPENIEDVEANSDENRAIKSTIIAFFENKVNEFGIVIDMPEGVSTPSDLYNNLKVTEIDILYKDADEANIKVIDTITKDKLVGLRTNQYIYTYNSSMPIKTLRDVDFTRVADKAPIRAKAQEVAGNRVMYGNYLARTSRPNKLNYKVTAGEKDDYGKYNSFNQIEYPNHNLKQNRSYEVGIVLVDKFGRQSDVITSDNSTVFSNYKQNIIGIKSYLGDSLKIDWSAAIPSIIDREGYAGLYSLTNPLGWYSYKVVVKQSAQDYYNVYLPTILNSRPQPDVLRINIASITQLDGGSSNPFGSLTTTSNPIPDFWLGAQLQGTDTNIGTGSTATLKTINKGGLNFVFDNPDLYTIGIGSATLVIPNKNIETSDDIAFITLLGDNINKVPRDLSTSGSQDLTFSSSVKLYGRVWNNRYYNNANSSRQYFPVLNGSPDSISNIGLVRDSSGGDDSTGNPAYISPFYTVPNVELRGGSPYIGTINTKATIGAYGGNSEPQVSFEKLRLNVYETTPLESNLDIYYESSSSGLISQLNSYINQDESTNQPSAITDWSWELNESNVPGDYVNIDFFDVTNSNGKSIIGAELTGEIIQITNGAGTRLSNTSYFTLEPNLVNGNDKYKFKLKIAAGRYFVYDSNSPSTDKYTFTFRFTNLVSGLSYVTNITTSEPNELDNNVPSYAAIPNPIPTNPPELIASSTGYSTLYDFDGKNGTSNTTDSLLFKKGLVWKVISADFKWVGNGNSWTAYTPSIGQFGNSTDFTTVSYLAFYGETLLYDKEFVALNVNAPLVGDVLTPQTGLYDYNSRVDTEFRVELELTDASGSNGNLSTFTTIYFTLLKTNAIPNQN